MERIIQPELLDTLPPDDVRAIRSRQDLVRINYLMRNHVLMARELGKNLNGHSPGRITEIGAGDGKFFLRVAQEFSNHGQQPHVTLLDLQSNVAPETLAILNQFGWTANAVVADIFEHSLENNDVILANLFLHHFEKPRLEKLFGTIAQRTELFIAIEPRRAWWPLFCSRLLWAIGCNSVTRHDAVVSVRAGFTSVELSVLWPKNNGWQLTERSVGLFSHLFIARKID